MGDARGHWEGKTLVVETTNFTDRTNYRGASKVLMVERLRQSRQLVDAAGDAPTTIHGRGHGPCDEPDEGRHATGVRHACHNHGLSNIPSAARAEEK